MGVVNMTKNRSYTCLSIISSLLVIAGLILVFLSINFGTSLADSWVINEGGSVDTNQYNIILKSHINNFLIIGSILFGSGLLAAIYTYFSFLLRKIKEKN
jgi:hypothetical protein